MGDLMEKVLVFDAGLDDMAIEMCKYVTKMEIASKSGDNEAAAKLMSAPFHFYKADIKNNDGILTFIYPYDGKMVSADVGYNVYEDCQGIISRNPHIKAVEGFEKIDAEWLSSMMK